MFYMSTCVGYRYGHVSFCLEDFLGGMGSGTRRRSSQLASHLASKRRCGFPYSDWLRACPRTTIAWVPLPFPVPPSVITNDRGTGISTCWPSATPFGLAL